MNSLIRYFTLRKRVKQLLVDSVQRETILKKEYIKKFNVNNLLGLRWLENEIEHQSKLSELLRNIL